MDYVLDTSAVLAVVLNEPAKQVLVRRTAAAAFVAPISLPIEVGNAFSAMFKRGRLALDQAVQAFESFRHIPVRLAEIDYDASLQIAQSLGIYAYDAYMLECAQRHRVSLLTLDEGLRTAAERIGVEVVGVMQ